MRLNSCEWHERLGHTCDKTVISFLKQNVPLFDHKSWQPFYCGTCAVAKSTHRLARARTKIPKESPLYLQVSDVMGPFATNPQGFHYLVTVRDHASTYSVVYPLKALSDSPEAILDAIKQFQVRLQLAPKALWMDNAWEFTSSLAKLGVSFYPSLPSSPQENGEAKRLNRMLGDMAQSMILESWMPDHFWRFAYASACFLHNQLPNSQCPKSSPHEHLFGHPPSMGTEAIVHVPAVRQPHKLAPRGIACCLLKTLMTGGWLLWEPKREKMIHSAIPIIGRPQNWQFKGVSVSYCQ
ncbi:hypothetical protein O181_053608 [Austropuccinia psidii MF-1]|uniref:Integrase catalytic domain-containing protein n=1 Tax=Austropuccinia psidii MF-1 TaxID=1389203 RepID=A0A9Q3HQK4_9BASI|nr:hypothetical protein [Austropuccinia psidii MF-1]